MKDYVFVNLLECEQMFLCARK